VNASRGSLPPPDMGGLTGDWKTLQDLRRREAEKDQEAGRPEDAPDVQEEEQKGAPSAPAPSRPGRSRGGRRPAPAVKDAVAHTVRLEPEEASDVDRFVLGLRDDARRTRLDKAEVYRELVRLAREDDGVRRKLLRRLKP
jgi:hypothetical protein